MIAKPMKCVALKDNQIKKYFKEKEEILGSIKLDGLRCLVTPDGVKTPSMKLHPNEYIRQELSGECYLGLDGELVVGDIDDPKSFLNTTGPIRRKKGEPDFTFYIFDHFIYPEKTYKTRFLECVDFWDGLPHTKALEQVPLYSVDEVIDYEAKIIERGFEGIILRDPYGVYKEGRTTLRELNMFKRKPLEDTEGIIIGFEEQMENQNEATINELGLTKRSSHQENKVGKDTLGSFIVKSELWDEEFHIGTGDGLTENLRKEIWLNQDTYIGKTIVFTYQKIGSDKRPRIPIWKGFRDEWDITK